MNAKAGMSFGLELTRQTAPYDPRRKLAAALSQKNFKWGPSISRISIPARAGPSRKDGLLVHLGLHL